jgi:hypothetical protein
MYLNLLRTSIEPVAVDFEDAWSAALLPRGTSVRFDRTKLLRDDLGTTATTLSVLVAAGIMTTDEAREYLALGARGVAGSTIVSPVDTVPGTTPNPDSTDEGDPTQGDQ